MKNPVRPVGPRALPVIEHKGKKYTFDYRLRQLRLAGVRSLTFLDLDHNESELLDYAVKTGDKHLIKVNMDEILEGFRTRLRELKSHMPKEDKK